MAPDRRRPPLATEPLQRPSCFSRCGAWAYPFGDNNSHPPRLWSSRPVVSTRCGAWGLLRLQSPSIRCEARPFPSATVPPLPRLWNSSSIPSNRCGSRSGD